MASRRRMWWATATSRRSARWIPARCSRGSSWRPPASAAGTTKPGAAAQLARLQAEPLPAPAWFQQQLQRLGYASPQTGTLDRATINVLAAFQMHYRPARYDGQPTLKPWRS